MMWYLQLMLLWAGMVLAKDDVLHAVLACLALATLFGPTRRVAVVLTVLVHVVLALT